MMRLLFVADGRSPIALNWISYFVDRGYEAHLVSTFACEPAMKLASLEVAPVAFSSLKSSAGQGRVGAQQRGNNLWSGAAVRLRTQARQWLGPLTLPSAARRLKDILAEVQPDLVHAMRIPYEGMLAALACESAKSAGKTAPLLISVWGNDFTLHAPSTPLMGRYTRRALAGATALHTDCQRDLDLARHWGFATRKPGIVLPGAGGIQLDTFFPEATGEEAILREPTVINPRGFRAYVRNDVFFRAIPLVLETWPQARFLCPTMAGETTAERWVKELGIAERVDLLPTQTRRQMADLFRRSQIVVSPSIHDGTPNSLLEAMACGCFPVAGDLESLREWITPGVNGLLVDPTDARALAAAISSALHDAELRIEAKRYNTEMIAARASYPTVMGEAEAYYRHISILN